MIYVKKVIFHIIGFLCFVLINNIVINTILVFHGTYHFYSWGIVCEPGMTSLGKITLIVFLFFKFSVLWLYVKKFKILYYYIVIDLLFIPAYLLYLLFNFDFLLGCFYSNRPLLNLSLYLSNTYIIMLFYSLLSLFIIRNHFQINKS